MRNPYELKSYADFLRVYPYLEELKKQSPVQFFPETKETQGLQGYATGSRYEPWETRKPRGTYIKLGLSPEEETEVRRHEQTHVATDISPNWSYIMATQQPTKTLNDYLGLTYPKQLLLEEAMIRSLETRPTDEIGMALKNRNKEMLTEDQRRLLESYRRMSQYGKQWGSFVGPEYDERELREGKGQDIVPRPPNVEIRNPYPQWYQKQVTEQNDPSLRPDGTKKGLGYFGPLPMTDKSGRVMTEYSIGVNFGDKEVLIPTLVPTLNKKELDYLLGGGTINESSIGKRIFNKAVDHAKERLANGKSPFADEVQQEPTDKEEMKTRGLYQPTWSSVSNE